MKYIGIILTIFVIVSCSAANNEMSLKHKQKSVMSSAEKVYISYIEGVGRLMFLKDMRAARATDILLSKNNLSKYPNFVGWVTYPNNDDFTVSFYELDGKKFKIVADVIFGKETKPIFILEPKRKPSGFEKSMVLARIAALESGLNSCSEDFNTIIIPSIDDAMWDVYVMAANTNTDMVQFGGHIKVTVAKSTAEVIKKLPLSKSCLAIDKTGKNDLGMPQDAKVVALTVSHIISPMPIAIHPYLSLLHRIDLAVTSPDGFWMVEAGKLRLVSRELKAEK